MKNKKEKIFIKILSVCLVLIFVFVIYWFRNPFVSEITIEAGQEIKLNDLIKYENARSPQIITEISDDITNKVGTHQITVNGNDREHTVSIHVIDTIVPEVTTQTYTYYIGNDFDASEFIKKSIDETTVTATMKDKIDLNVEDTYNVEIVFSDEGNNTVTKTAKLIVKKDTEPPVIEAPTQITVVKGEAVLYKKQVTVTDNCDGEITNFEVDNSKVNLTQVGSYYVTYSAIDKNGNKAIKTVLVAVTSKEAAEAKKEAKEYAQKILKEIITDSMDDEDKLKAIYDYVMYHYTYVATHEDALNGFKTGRGDCYVVNAMARFLLDEVGIDTYGLVLEGTDMNHISFMANVGDGWYHYCAFKKKSGIRIYKWTDEQMIEHYSFAGITSIPDTLPDTCGACRPASSRHGRKYGSPVCLF